MKFTLPSGRMNIPASELPSQSEVYHRVTSDFGTLNHSPENHSQEEDEIIEALDDKKIFIETMKDWMKFNRRMKTSKDPQKILMEATPQAARTFAMLTFFGSERAKIEASREILNRTIGKPVERQMNLTADISNLSMAEVDREILRITHKIDYESEPIQDERGREEATSLRPEAKGDVTGRE